MNKGGQHSLSAEYERDYGSLVQRLRRSLGFAPAS